MPDPKMNASTQVYKYPYLSIDNQGQLVRFDLTKSQHILGRDPSIADLSLPDSWQVVSRRQATICQDGDGCYIYDGDRVTPSSNRLYLNKTLITPEQGCRLTNGMRIEIGLDPKTLIQIEYVDPNVNIAVSSAVAPKSVSLDNGMVTLGRDPIATLPLDAPTISRKHATIDRDNNGRYILRDRSTNGVFVNGQRVNQAVTVTDGATIKIGPFTLVVRDNQIQMLDRGDRIRLDVHNLILETNGKRRLDDLSFALEPGQFVALVGGSGAGKSTLMRTLLGVEAPTQGAVYLNGTDLRKNFNIYRRQIGYVPQDDIIHMDLRVEEVLEYAARLRLPPDIELKSVVDRALDDIKMTHRRKATIVNLSGGQRKRVSIGVELLANPKLFFLDEPTSGLDPGLDKQMMELLRDLAHDGGRTIVLVTHATANITACDRIVFLGRDGKFCYFGSPDEALKFFGVTDFADIYIKLEDVKEIDRYVNLYRQSGYYQKYVANSLNPATSSNTQIPPTAKQVNPIAQWSIFTKRQLALLSRDRLNLALALLTAPIGITFLAIALQDNNPFIIGDKLDAALPALALQVLFVFTCASLWVGLSSSLQEIVKESAIYLRERLINLNIPAYLGSKFSVLAILAILQTFLIVLTVGIEFKAPTTAFMSWQLGLFITTWLTLIASASLGLLVSAIVKNGSQANGTLPLILLPQIIFSGVLFKLKGVGTIVSYLMLCRWSIGAYGTIANVNNLLPANLKTEALADLPFPTGAAYDQTWNNLTRSWSFLLVHIIVYLTITGLLQKRKDIL
jgi:ABC transport system ATP-binding/permease protein